MTEPYDRPTTPDPTGWSEHSWSDRGWAERGWDGEPTATQSTSGSQQPGPYPGISQSGHGQQAYGSPGYGPQAGYPQPYGYGYQPAPEHPQGTTILVLGVLGVVFSPLGFVAWYLGSKTEKEIQASGLVYSNLGSIKTGKILGIVFSILTIVSVALLIGYVVFMLIFMGAVFSTALN